MFSVTFLGQISKIYGDLYNLTICTCIHELISNPDDWKGCATWIMAENYSIILRPGPEGG